MKSKIILGVVIGLVLLVGGFSLGKKLNVNDSFGSVGVGQEYSATSTLLGLAPSTYYFTARTLGSVVITSSSVASVTILDSNGSATTTVAVLKASLAEGTYVFDRRLDNGLALTFSATSTGSIIFTYR